MMRILEEKRMNDWVGKDRKELGSERREQGKRNMGG
jgi:hypothetical protein